MELARWREEVRRTLPHLAADVQEEIAQHAAERWRDARARGLDADAATEIARRELREWIRVELPAAPGRRGWRALAAGIGIDVRSARRALGRRPGSALAGVFLCAMAVGASVAAFALAYGILWRPLPYPDEARLSVVWNVFRGEQGQVAYPDYIDFRRAPVFDGAAAMMGGRASVRVADGADVERVYVLDMEPEGLQMLGAVPVAGRLLTQADAGRPVVLLSHRFWRRHFAADPAAVGASVWVSGTTYTIVGVLQEGFDFELPVGAFELKDHDLWMPFDTASPFVARRDASTYEVLVRRAPGVSTAEAQAALDAIGARLARDHAATNAGRTFRLLGLREHIVAEARPVLLLLLGAAALTFAIAVANLATLTLARLSERQAELAVREALGAGRFRLRTQTVLENVMMAAAGTAAGTVFAAFAVRALVASDAADLPRPGAVAIDAPVLLAALLAGLGVAVALSFLPARLSNALSLLRGSSRVTGLGTRLTRRALVPIELALALSLSVGGALIGLSLARVLAVDPGFATGGVASMRVSAYAERYPGRAETVAFFESIVSRLRERPQVAEAAASSSLPLSGQMSGVGVLAEGQPADPASHVSAGWQVVTPGYIRAAGLALEAGRDFTAADRGAGPHHAIISASLARRLFPDGRAVGRRISTGGGNDWHVVVGVVGDVRHSALSREPEPRVYDLAGEHWSRTMFVIARADGEPSASLLNPMRAAVRERDAEAPVFEMATIEELVRRSAATRALALRAAAGLAGVAVAIALLGVYGVVAAGVAARRREFGVRLALGASPRALVRRVLFEQLAMVAGGSAIGLAVSALLVRLLGSLLYGVDNVQAAGVALTMAVVIGFGALGAVLVPARRTSQVDPMTALRE